MDEDRIAIETLLTRFGHYADRGDGEALSHLFLTSGVLNVNSKIAEGQQAIAKLANERTADPSQKIRHLWSNLLVEKRDSSSIHASCIQMTFERRGDSPAAVRVNDVLDIFSKTEEGVWWFSSRTITRQITVGG
jgi:hypothetical protein